MLAGRLSSQEQEEKDRQEQEETARLQEEERSKAKEQGQTWQEGNRSTKEPQAHDFDRGVLVLGSCENQAALAAASGQKMIPDPLDGLFEVGSKGLPLCRTKLWLAPVDLCTILGKAPL